jgi:hypothetical protein
VLVELIDSVTVGAHVHLVSLVQSAGSLYGEYFANWAFKLV